MSVKPQRERKRQWWPILGAVVAVLLAAAVITLGSFRVPLQPDERSPAYVFFPLFTLIAATFFVFSLILGRSLFRLWVERRSGLLGSRFKVNMVLGAMGVSLGPVVVMFFFSYGIVNRTLNLWFPQPLEIANDQGQELLSQFETSEFNSLNGLATSASERGVLNEAFLEQARCGRQYFGSSIPLGKPSPSRVPRTHLPEILLLSPSPSRRSGF